MPEDQARFASMPAAVQAAPDRQVIRTADLHLRVKEFGKPYREITDLAEALGGFIASTEVQGAEDPDVPTSGTVVLRLPAKSFHKALARIRPLGKVLSEGIHGEDVTEQFVDLESRLRNLRRTEDQLLELFKRSGKVEEILKVESELSRVRGEIETAQGRLRYLKDRVAFSTITVTLSEKASLSPTPTDEWEYSSVLKRAVRGLLVTLRSLAAFATWVVVFAVVWVPAIALAKAVRRRRRQAKDS